MSSNAHCPFPDTGNLHEAALTHLARYAATEAGLRRVLIRQVDRWAAAQTDPETAAATLASAREAIEEVITRLVQAGAVSDTAFAEHRARTLLRSGQSSRAVQARLLTKGVAPDVARSASATDPETELAAALVLMRKRRIGAFGVTHDARPGAQRRMKDLGLLARAGFARDIAEQALTMSREEAESRIFNLRR